MWAVIEIIRDRKFIKHGRGEKKRSKYLKYFRPALKNGFRSEIGGDKLFDFLKKMSPVLIGSTLTRSRGRFNFNFVKLF